MSDKVVFLLLGSGLLVLDAILFAKRRSFARVMCDFMFPVLHPQRRAVKQVQLESMFRVLLGVFVPVIMVIWLALAAAS